MAPLSGGVTQYGAASIDEMVVWRDKLYVVGAFDNADGIPIHNNMACWDGAKWCSVGDTIENVSVIGVFHDELYIGGGFSNINGDSSYYRVAKWTGGDYAEYCAEPLEVPEVLSQGFTLSPNPMLNGRFTLAMDGIDRSGILVAVRDVSGRQVYSRRHQSANRRFSCEIDLGDTPRGIYFVELWKGPGRIVGKVVLQ
jgi:hypothetical protein